MPWSRLSLKWGALLGALVLGLGTLFLFREPRVRGHTLDEWLKEGLMHREVWHNGNQDEVTAAIREIGPQAIPILLAKLQATDPAWKTNLAELLGKQALFSFEFTWAYHEQVAALYAFEVLGTNAAAALPALEKMFWDTNTTAIAGDALGRIGEAALPILRAGLTNAEHDIRWSAYSGSSVSRALAATTLSDMRQMQSDPDEVMAAAAVGRLMIFADNEEATRLAIEALESNRLRVRRVGLSHLTRANLETNRVVPILIQLLEDPDWFFRRGVTNVLKTLDPVAAAAAGINIKLPPVDGRSRPGRGPVSTNQPAAPRQ